MGRSGGGYKLFSINKHCMREPLTKNMICWKKIYPEWNVNPCPPAQVGCDNYYTTGQDTGCSGSAKN